MKFFIFFIVSLLFCTKVHAAYTCSGSVSGISINPKNGQLLVDNIAGLRFPVLCSLKDEQNGVSIEVCSGIYSMLLSAQMAQKEVTLWFNDESSGGSCNSHDSWTFLSGWYFGPMLK